MVNYTLFAGIKKIPLFGNTSLPTIDGNSIDQRCLLRHHLIGRAESNSKTRPKSMMAMQLTNISSNFGALRTMAKTSCGRTKQRSSGSWPLLLPTLMEWSRNSTSTKTAHITKSTKLPCSSIVTTVRWKAFMVPEIPCTHSSRNGINPKRKRPKPKKRLEDQCSLLRKLQKKKNDKD